MSTVIVNDYDLIKETFSKPELLHRPSAWLLKDTTEGASAMHAIFGTHFVYIVACFDPASY